MGEFLCLKLPFFIHNFVWVNSRRNVCKWKRAKIKQGKNKSVYSICNICESLQIYGASRNCREYCSLGNNPPLSQMCSSPDQVLELKIIVLLFWKIYEINEESISQNCENCNNKKKMKIVTGRLESNRKALTNKRFKYASGLCLKNLTLWR